MMSNSAVLHYTLTECQVGVFKQRDGLHVICVVCREGTPVQLDAVCAHLAAGLLAYLHDPRQGTLPRLLIHASFALLNEKELRSKCQKALQQEVVKSGREPDRPSLALKLRSKELPPRQRSRGIDAAIAGNSTSI